MRRECRGNGEKEQYFSLDTRHFMFSLDPRHSTLLTKGGVIQMPSQPTPTATGPSTTTKLAYERTNLAHERTLMSWVRTATSLITFGFTIYKFFQFEKGT